MGKVKIRNYEIYANCECSSEGDSDLESQSMSSRAASRLMDGTHPCTRAESPGFFFVLATSNHSAKKTLPSRPITPKVQSSLDRRAFFSSSTL